ncbi:MAG: hypothetical protein ABSE49_35390, partial [Polyangiaceae bacterium]
MQFGSPIKSCLGVPPGRLRVFVKRLPPLGDGETHAAEVRVEAIAEVRIEDVGTPNARAVSDPRPPPMTGVSHGDGEACDFDLVPGKMYRVTCAPSLPYFFHEPNAATVVATVGEQSLQLTIDKYVRLFRLRLFRGGAPRTGTVAIEAYASMVARTPLDVQSPVALDADGGFTARIRQSQHASARAAAIWFLDANGERTRDGLFLHVVAEDSFDPTKDEDVARMLWGLGLTETEPRLRPPTVPGDPATDYTGARFEMALALGWFQRRLGFDATLPAADARVRLWQYYRVWPQVARARWGLYAPRAAFAGDAPATAPMAGGHGWDSFHDYQLDPRFETASLIPDQTATERDYVNALRTSIPTFHADFMNEAPAANVAELEKQAKNERTRRTFVSGLVFRFGLEATEFDPTSALANEKPAMRRHLFALLKNMTWPEVKDYFVLEPHDPHLALELKKVLVAILNFRQTYFWKMLKAIAAAPAMGGHDRALFAKSVGSGDLTSDIDVTTSGSMDVPVMQRVYELVKAEWGAPSPLLFDVMFYGRDWLMVFDNIIGPVKDRPDRWFQVRTFDPVMDLYGLAAIVRFASDDDWTAFARSVRHDVGVPGLAEPPMFSRLDLVRSIYQKQYVAPASRAIGVANDKDAVERSLHGGARAAAYLAEHNRLNVELMAAARCDEDLVFHARPPGAEALTWKQYNGQDAIELPLAGGVGAAIAWIERQNQIVPQQALFAHEGYLTGGAMMDVVGSQGNKVPKDMTVQHLLQSFNDQAGNAFKELYEYKRENDDRRAYEAASLGAARAAAERDVSGSALGASPLLLKGAWRASKYEIRMSAALQKITKMLGEDARVMRRQ